MRYFVLVDLMTQAEFLPPEMQTWSQERVLSWLRLFGEVTPRLIDWAVKYGYADHPITVWLFRSLSGREAHFVVSKSNQFALLIAGARVYQLWGEEITSLFDLET